MYRAMLLLLIVSPAWAAPPAVDVPAELKPVGDYVTLNPKTDAKAITYVGLSGVEPFPSQFLKDSKSFVLPTRGLPVGRYEFAGVASLNDEHTTFRFVVVVGKEVAPPVVVPPVVPPVAPTSALYFLVVRADGPAAPGFTRTMADPAWATLRTAGHLVKDKTISQAAALGVRVPDGTVLPVVVTLRVAPDGSSSTIVRDAVPLPSASTDILDLPKGVK